jgi:enoyl-CoA hydratase/carnithine racemase
MTVKENNLQMYFNERFKKLYDSTDEVVFMDGDRYNIPKRKMILLNRPKALNALNLPMVRTMYKQMLEWQDSLQIQMVIIKGAGEKAFCAGGDVLGIIVVFVLSKL